MQLFRCDRCGKEIHLGSEPVFYLRFLAAMPTGGPAILSHSDDEPTYCLGCKDAIEIFARTPPPKDASL